MGYNIMAKKTNNKKSVKRNQRGGRVSMPSEFFGKNSGSYYSKGSSQLIAPASAYGKTFTSRTQMAGKNMFGSDPGPFSKALGVTRMQTGGKRKTIKKRKETEKVEQL